MTLAERILEICRDLTLVEDPITIEDLVYILNETLSAGHPVTHTEILGALMILVDEASVDVAYDGMITLTIAGEE